MNKGKVLIITHSEDNNVVDTVIQQIEHLGGSCVRFDVDRYPVESRLSSSFINGQWQGLLETPQTTSSLDDITAVWYRRSYHIGKGLETLLEKEYLSSTLGELRRTLFGMLEGLKCFQIEKYSVYRRLDSKEEQLRIAKDCGLEVPATCITNSPAQLKAFLENTGKPVIAKMQSAFAIYRDGQEHVVFTNEVTTAHLDQLNELRYCPMVFQEKLEKALELRVTIVGREIFCFSIDSKQLVDWRKEGAALADAWQAYTLPSNISLALLTFMDTYGLNYGAIDLILTPEGKCYFLEVNAAGEYFWLDKQCNNAISRHLAAVLLNQAERRE
ncbi:MvdD family ATP-grasp ribosomal peptide maturase [Chitinophaga sp. SYP-B3965]|uniref:MvdC/MvdD family ATP grasp protein n=1 Tax=Chitinophaga sp. SYP-B3965 TaxID=2663120 RepID=UPI0012998E25|nr:MvdD family ATP-grasp ribosomal peptide maturase [Chitinophaga sp. SYP-B3965]MRG43603.1 MvdD family ATP-grasp ribosomal peptide maturase [Chitinophaga sp. SYP-B3965]